MDSALANDAVFKLSTIALEELLSGAYARLEDFLPFVEIEARTADDANATVLIRADLEGRGLRIGGRLNALITGQALARGWAVVSADIEDFRRIAGLTLIDWSDRSGASEYRT
jgi:tRNA(fMet)-specific endonuclease VapC